MGLLLDVEDTAVTRQTAQALARVGTVAAVPLIALAVADADDNQADWSRTGVHDALVGADGVPNVAAACASLAGTGKTLSRGLPPPSRRGQTTGPMTRRGRGRNEVSRPRIRLLVRVALVARSWSEPATTVSSSVSSSEREVWNTVPRASAITAAPSASVFASLGQSPAIRRIARPGRWATLQPA